MKKLLLLIGILISQESLLFGQAVSDSTKTKKDSLLTEKNNNSIQYGKITVSSPTASALGKYAEQKVDFSTGTPNIDIPLATISDGDLSHSFSLNHHASAIKVAETPSWVGMNWSLGGMGVINRTIMGGPDESWSAGLEGMKDDAPGVGTTTTATYSNVDGFYTYGMSSGSGGFKPFDVIRCPTDPNYVATALDEFRKAASGRKDTEPDIFTFNVAGYTGKFYLSQGRKIVLIPQQDIKIEPIFNWSTYEFTAWVMILPNGNRYTFEAKERSRTVLGAGIYPVISNTKTLVSSWFLTKIETPDKQKVINFEYAEDYIATRSLVNERINTCDCGVGKYAGPANGTRINSTGTNSKRLTRVYSNTTEMIFHASNREDLYGGKRLDWIEVKGITNTTSCKKFVLNYDYLQSNVPTSTETDGFISQSVPLATSPEEYKRLRLLSCQEKSCNETEAIPPYVFSYNDAIPLPMKMSYHQDHGGYFNGYLSSASLIADDCVRAFNNPSNLASTAMPNRSINSTFTQVGVLKQIKYPTGGIIDYEFEGNSGDKVGIRIKKITEHFGNNPDVITNYEYATSRDYFPYIYSVTNPTNYAWSNSPYLVSSNCNTSAFNAICYINQISKKILSSNIYGEISALIGRNVNHENVTVKRTGNGKSIYFYDFALPTATFTNEVPFSPSSALYYGTQGYMSAEKHYNQSDILQKETNYFYNQATWEGDSTKAFRVFLEGCSASLTSQGATCPGVDNDLPIYREYALRTIKINLLRREEKVYRTDGTAPMVMNTHYAYGNFHRQAIREATKLSNGDSLITTTKFIYDYGVPLSYSASDPTGSDIISTSQLGFAKYLNINLPIEKTTYLKKTTETNATMLAIGGQISGLILTSYSYTAGLKIGSIYTLATPDRTSIIPSSVVAGQFVYDATKYDLRVKYYYDNKSNLLGEYPLTNVGFYYGYDSKNRLSFITKGSNTNVSQATGYAYDDLFGLIQSTTVNNLNETYVYDALGRLKTIKDHENNIVKQYDYAYSPLNVVTERIPLLASATLSSPQMVNESYIDSLGRPLLSVMRNASGDQSRSIVTNAQTYDAIGRVSKQYIPFASNATALPTLPTMVDADPVPYAEITDFDNSPLNRPLTKFGSGNAWRLANKFMSYSVANYNIANEIRLFRTTATGASSTGFYAPEELSKEIQTDEQGAENITFKNKSGNVIESWVQNAPNEYLKTVYVYDDLERLAFVIQPEQSPSLTSFSLDDAPMTAGIFAYQYDSRNRTIKKHIPGGGWTELVYDKLDRPVASQDPLQKSENKWAYTKYDGVGRIAMTGIKQEFADRQTLQTNVDALTHQFEERGSTLYGFTNRSGLLAADSTLRMVTHFDEFNNVHSCQNYISFKPTDSYHTSYANQKGLVAHTMVKNQAVNDWTCTRHHYDNQNRLIQTIQQFNAVGKLRRSWLSRQYGHNDELLTEKYRQTKSILDSADVFSIETQQYDHRLRLSAISFGIAKSDTIPTLIANYFYDSLGRLQQKILMPNQPFFVGGALDYLNRNTNPNTTTLDIARKAICILPNTVILPANGVYTAQVNPSASNGTPITGLQTIDYAYHLRGGLRGINLDATGNPSPNASQGDLFAYKLDYETAGQWDGNIGRETWKSSRNTGTARQYNFQYDAAKRLKSATYSGGSFAGENYGIENINYDKNGNILTFWRQGVTAQTNNSPTAFGYVDKMQYFYSSNRLSVITDAVVGNVPVDDFRDNTSNADYTYWPDGSIKSDGNRGINLITWDTFLKKVKQIDFADGRWIKHFYDGSGNRLKTTDSQGIIWEYIGGQVYKNGVLYQVNHEEGRVIFENGAYLQEFSYDDHLGNSRVSFRATGNQLQLTQENAYYPFGLSHYGTDYSQQNGNNFLYNGKEKISSFGLNYSDYGFRTLDLLSNRFISVDPLSDEQEAWTPFHYTYNNPVRYTDPDGRTPCCGDTKEAASGFFEGLGQAFVRNVKAVTVNLPETLQGMADSFTLVGQYQAATGARILYEKTKNDWNTGDVRTRANIVGNVVGEAGIALAGTRGAGNLGKSSIISEIAKVGETSEMITIYRGINTTSPAFNAAKSGIVKPRGGILGHTDALIHNTGVNGTSNSKMTSWTTNPEVAKNYALRTSGNGVVVSQQVPKTSLIASPNLKDVRLIQGGGKVSESEVLLIGTQRNLNVQKIGQ